jgi:4-amino-4-deoxy-L-arabinose transferase-like glycosyltransferase
MKKTSLLLLTLISLLGLVLRFYQLGKIPAGLYLDEAGQGYSAYSILKTGKDEFGKAFPVIFRSFNDFKTPVYIYLIVPLIPFFGLTALTVRFPSFFFSVLTFPLLYFLIKKVSPKAIGEKLALLSVFLLAISPWHILFGRTNFECNVALFFTLLGIYLFYLGLAKPKLLLLSSVIFAIAFPAYHSQRVIVPLILLVFFIRHRRTLLDQRHRLYTLSSVILGLILCLPTIMVLATPGFLARVSALSIFSVNHTPWGANSTNMFFTSFLRLREFASMYLSYFSPRQIFWLGDSGLRSSFPHLSTFFVWQLPFYLAGLYLFITNKALGELRFLTLFLLLISPLPASLTLDPYSTIRSLPMVIPLIIIISYALIRLSSRFPVITQPHKILSFPRGLCPRRESISRFIIIITSLLFFCYSLFKLYTSIFLINEYQRAPYWDYGWEQVADTLQTLDPTLPVIVDNARGEPYIHLLFFLRFDPVRYQRENQEIPLSQYYTNMKRDTNKHIGQIETRPIDWKPDMQTEQYIVADNVAISPGQIEEHHLEIIREIRYPNNSIAFYIVKTNPNKKKQSQLSSSISG